MKTSYSKALEIARDLCRENDAELLYLTVFGSVLYGTSSGASDLDLWGIYLPSLKSRVLGENKRSLHFSSAQNAQKNCADDLDIDLWALDYWLLNLLPAGDTGALDLLFSPSNNSCVLLKSELLKPVFSNSQKFLNLARNSAYAEYSLGQAKKYGVKGSRLGALRSVWKWLLTHKAEGRLREHLDDILASCGNEKYCFAKMLPDGPALVLCGKIHTASIKMSEFGARIVKDMEHYGARAIAAEANQGLDFKALSHAMRALDQVEELLLTGKICFPLKSRKELIKIKNGEIAWEELEPMLLKRLAEVNILSEKLSSRYIFDHKLAKNILLSCYGFGSLRDKSAVCEHVERELAKLEGEYGVKIVFAAEAGSRAWGFPSQNSDYDIRFIYVHNKNWYLGAAPEKRNDVIIKAIDIPDLGLLDLSGWELRKALRIMQNSNPQIAEWLFSPIVYRNITDFAVLMKQLLPKILSLGSMALHYHGLFKNALKKLSSGNHSPKAVLYVARALLVLKWLEKYRAIPPVDIRELMLATVESPLIKTQIDNLIERKRYANEEDNQAAGHALTEWFKEENERLEKLRDTFDYSREKLDADSVFLKILEQAFQD